jgi:hypothetical protein
MARNTKVDLPEPFPLSLGLSLLSPNTKLILSKVVSADLNN